MGRRAGPFRAAGEGRQVPAHRRRVAPEDPDTASSCRSCPLDETKLAALDLHDDIKELAETHYNPYVIPVLVFPDMEPDEAIRKPGQAQGRVRHLGNRPPDDRPGEIVRSRGVSDQR